MTTVLKVGGSVITEKTADETVNESALDRVAAALSDAEDLVLIHGGGSFGHPVAERFGVSDTQGTRDANAAWAIHEAMTRLNRAVIDRLQEHGVPALPIRPLSMARRAGSGDLSLGIQAVEGMLAAGFLPVLHGDGVVDDGTGIAVLGGDELVVAVADVLGADRVGLCSGTPGVLDNDGDVVPIVERYADVAPYVDRPAGVDVTGGMSAKVRTLLGFDGRARIFGLEDLEAFVAGADPGTLIR